MLIGVCSVKGSPGVTVTALALGARWPGADPFVVEADPAGGDLLSRFRLPANPGLVSLAAATRRNPDPGLLAEHSHLLPGGLRVVPGPVAADQARAALEVLTSRGATAIHAPAREANSIVVVDAGRLDGVSPALPLIRGADALLVLVRPRSDELMHLMTLFPSFPKWTRTPGLVLVGTGYAKAEIERELRIPVMGMLPDDPRGARVLCGETIGPDPDRSRLGRAVAVMARNLVREIAARAQHTMPVNAGHVVPAPRFAPTSNGTVLR